METILFIVCIISLLAFIVFAIIYVGTYEDWARIVVIISAVICILSATFLTPLHIQKTRTDYANKVADGYEVYVDGIRVDGSNVDIVLYKNRRIDDDNKVVYISTAKQEFLWTR